MDSGTLNFKKIPRVLNFSGASVRSTASSMRTASAESTPFSDRIYTPLTGTPLSQYTVNCTPKPYKLDNITNSRHFESSPGFHHKRKQVNRNHEDRCAFCAEALYNIFEGERLVDLDCGHSLHLGCLTEAVNMSIMDGNSELQSSAKPINHIHGPSSSEIVCPECNHVATYLDEILPKTMCGANMANPYHGSCTSNEDKMQSIMTNIENFEMPDLTAFMESPIDQDNTGGFIDSANDSTTDENPITPQGQMGMNFWQRDSILDPIFPLSTDSVNTACMPSNTNSTANDLQSSFQNDIELAQVLFAPEFSSINVEREQSILSNVECVVNIATTEFETSLKSNQEEQFKTQIGKNKITNIIISNFEEKLNAANDTPSIRYSNLGSLIMFDLIDVTIKLDVFELCQVYLFESNIIILDESGSQLLLNQDINTDVFISSIYEKKDDLIINLNSIKVPSIVLTSSNKLLKHKWYVILNKLSKKVRLTDINIPLIQISTNAWNLISENNDLYDDAIPEDIKVVHKLTSKGLDLPSKFLRRQILRPDSAPKVLILALPLINCEDYGLENYEYAEAIKRIISITLSSLNSNDKLGIVFLGNHIKNLATIGNYYGCVSPDWDGWHTVLESIKGDIIAEEDRSSNGIEWKDGLTYIDLLAKIGFAHFGLHKDEYIHQVICVTHEILCHSSTESPTGTITGDEGFNPFVERANGPLMEVNRFISSLCEKYNANFDFVLLADEFRFEPHQIMSMRRYIKGYASTKGREICKEEYNNKIRLCVALDFENLSETLNSKINDLHKVTIKKLETSVRFPDNVKLVGFESASGEIKPVPESTNNCYTISLSNLPSGFEKSLLFKLDIDISNIASPDKYKANIAKSTTKFFAGTMETQFDSSADIRLITDMDAPLENNVTLNINLEKGIRAEVTSEAETSESGYKYNERRGSDLNLAIVSKLSSVSDAYYVKRHIELLVLKKISEMVLDVRYFDSVAKENARAEFLRMKDTVWELANSCNSSNTNNMGSNLIQSWSEDLIVKIEEIIDGYSLRNYQLSNMKCVSLFLDLE